MAKKTKIILEDDFDTVDYNEKIINKNIDGQDEAVIADEKPNRSMDETTLFKKKQEAKLEKERLTYDISLEDLKRFKNTSVYADNLKNDKITSIRMDSATDIRLSLFLNQTKTSRKAFFEYVVKCFFDKNQTELNAILDELYSTARKSE